MEGNKELNIENEWGLFWVTPFIVRNYNKDNMQITILGGDKYIVR